MFLKRAILLLLILLLPLPLLALDAPPLVGRVNDLARLMSPEAQQHLEQKLAQVERETSNQIAVLTIPSLQGDDIDQFAIRVAEAWKLGQKGKDNGILLILAQSERKVRIEVGMGLQGVLPDISASHIIREVMRPHLKSGNFDQGIAAGVDAIIAATKGEFKAPATSPRKQASHRKSSSSGILIAALIAVAVLGIFSRYLGGAAGAVAVPLAAASAFPGLGVFALFLLAAAGLAGGFLLSMLLSSMFRGGGGYYGGGWGGGGFYGGGSSGGDGDSFSGGGGDFDGGGSSDDY